MREGRAIEVDKYVGNRVRMRRLLLGFSQEKVALALGLTFQQQQKYEKGTNRIGASRLMQLASILQTEPAYFLEGAPAILQPDVAALADRGADAKIGRVVESLSSAEGLILARDFARIKNPKVRRRIVDLVTSLAADEQEDSDQEAIAA